MKKNKRKIAIILTAVLVVVVTSCFVSYLKFDTANSFMAASGFVQISFSDKEYVEINSNPKVILAQPDASLVDYMESRGFSEIENEQLGALRVFTNGNKKEYVMYSQNGYFSKWRWE